MCDLFYDGNVLQNVSCKIVTSAFFEMESSIQYISKMFRKTNISYP